jgi:16S rRNA C967 or C1407 C5-methylase (RsmB/RsmF family)/NOL1/NOP2/fmu family ribosome biogenesis protein
MISFSTFVSNYRMKLPQQLLQSLEGVAGFDKEAFIRVHEEAKAPTSIRINPEKWRISDGESANEDSDAAFTIQHSRQIPWSKYGFYLPQRPSFTFDPLFHAGCYYVQEASSMFLEQAFKQLLTLSETIKVLDLCASPGGKSTHIQSLISSDSLLISNEVIKPRSIVLTDNIIKWGCKNVLVTNNDPKAFQKLPGYFDVMVVDAPCSGSGLFRKDEDAINEWSLHNVELCSHRQQRILADALPALKENGLLIYSTCSYSSKEDEEIMDWLVEVMEMENAELRMEDFEGIVTSKSASGATGYRFYPDKINGEGFFISCFRKRKDDGNYKMKPARFETVSSKDKNIIEGWVNDDGLEFIRHRSEIIAVPKIFLQDFLLIQPVLNIIYAGVKIGEVMKEKLVPHHALAQNIILSEKVPAIELDYEDAIKYLQRQELSFQPGTIGWQVARYKKYPLGWVNVLKNRTNNYYPKEIRILKAKNEQSFEK